MTFEKTEIMFNWLPVIVTIKNLPNKKPKRFVTLAWLSWILFFGQDEIETDKTNDKQERQHGSIRQDN